MKLKNISLIIFFTFLTALAQILLKLGAMKGVFNLYVIFGVFSYFASAILFVLLLKNIELSSLYPMISLGFVWVTLVSIFYLNETISFSKVSGIILIIFGVGLMGVKL